MKDIKSFNKIHEKLLEIREESGATYEEFAAKIGVSYASLWRWMNYGIEKINPSSKKLLLYFIREYEAAKKEDRVFQFFGEF